MTATLTPGVEIPTLEPGSPEWLQRMSASKIAAVLGLSPYESPFSLWHKMAGTVTPDPDTDLTRRGHYLEPAIAAWWADQHPEYAVTQTGTWRHADRDWQTANPDRLLIPRAGGPARLLELKSANDDSDWGPAGTDQIPVAIRAQVIWQMDTVGVEVCHVAVLGAYLEFREYEIAYSPDEAAFMRERALEFLATIARNERPSIDSHDATYEAIKQLHPQIDGSTVELDADLARRYCTARERLTAAEAEEKYARSLIADAMGSAQKAKFNGQTIARRQAKGDGTPYVVAGRSLPSFTEETTS